MQSRSGEDSISSLERAREALYSPKGAATHGRTPLGAAGEQTLPHAWEEKPLPITMHRGERHVRLAGIFLSVAIIFFIASLVAAGYFFYFGNNSVSTDKVSIDIQGPTTIAGGDTVPLSLTITNRNPVALENATIEVDFPDGTRRPGDVLTPYPRYVEQLGTLASGATVTRSIKAVVFGGAGQTVTLPVIFSYGTASSNAVFEKRASYGIAISSTPLSVSVDALTETVAGDPLTFTLTVRSNAAVPLDDVVLAPSSPFGFSVTSSSVPLQNGTFVIGTLAPGATKQVTLTGVLTGQNNEQRVFHFTVGTAKSSQDSTLAVEYMTQDATVTIAAPFISTKLAINGDTSDQAVIAPGSTQSVTVAFTNTLSTPVTNAAISIAVSGSAIDYGSIRAQNGFYNSVNHTIVFSKDTDSSLATLSPGESGLGTFTFSTVPAGGASPTVTFSVTATGTRVGESNVPEQVTASSAKTAKVATAIALSAASSHTSGIGPIPPKVGMTTGYSIAWSVANRGSAVAGGTVKAVLPNYVTYVDKTSGSGSFSYDETSHTLTWTTGDLAQGASARSTFQVTITPSSSQKGGAVPLTGPSTFSGYDRFAGVQVSASTDPVTTETKTDPGYKITDGIVQ